MSMRLVHDVNLEQQQKLLMTPELRQSIAILQMSSLELAEYVLQELEENPVLEMKEEDGSSEDDTGPETAEKTEEEQLVESEWLEYFMDRSDLGYTGRVDKDSGPQYENFLAVAPTLHEHLLFQLHISLSDEEDLRIGQFLIGSIDENGYLRITLSEAAQVLNTSEERLEEVLKIIHTFEPFGVGARNLSECLLIQLEQTGRINPTVEKVISEYLNDLARGRMAKIAATLGLTVLEVQNIGDLIRTLDPKPGRQYGSLRDVRYLVPDVTVEKFNGEYLVLVNDGSSPRLMINSMYQEMMRNPSLFNKDAHKYLEDRINSAVWLIKSIEHRRLTLYRVAKCIVEIQRDFLERGVKYLKPLNLKQVAELVGVHESTISRSTTNKYIQTPQGVFELKYFFCSGVESAAGSRRYSSRSVKRTIQEMINKEDARNPLSDQQIAEMLLQKGVQISRRTVAKYRAELDIASTAQRRRY